jgi:hypothetical protein
MLLELAVGKEGVLQEQVCLNCRCSNNYGSSACRATSNIETQVQAKRYPWFQPEAHILEETPESEEF